jgi:hypothetical protein
MKKVYGFLIVILAIAIISFFEKGRTRYMEVPSVDKSETIKKIFHHPEQRSDEMFFTNIDTTAYYKIIYTAEGMGWISSYYKIGNHPVPKGYKSEYSSIYYQSKRLGKVAYDTAGNPVSWLRPVFVKRAEYLKNNK